MRGIKFIYFPLPSLKLSPSILTGFAKRDNGSVAIKKPL